MERVLSDYDIEAMINEWSNIYQGRVQIINGDLHTGFELSMQKVAVVTEEEIFNKRTKRSPRRQKLSNAERIKKLF